MSTGVSVVKGSVDPQLALLWMLPRPGVPSTPSQMDFSLVLPLDGQMDT